MTRTWSDLGWGDHLWTNGNLGEAVPDVMTPCTWSVVSRFLERALAAAAVPGVRVFGRIEGRFYLDLSMIVSLGAVFGVPARRTLASMEPIFGTVPADVEVPLVALPRLRTAQALARSAVVGARRAHAARRGLDARLTALPAECDALRADLATTTAPAALWRSRIAPLFDEVGDLMDVARRDGKALVTVPARLTRVVGPADAAALTSTRPDGGDTDLASLGPLLGLDRLARGEIDAATWARLHGHRGPQEFELSVPRPAEDPAWLDRQLALLRSAPTDPRTLLARREADRARAWERLVAAHPRRSARAERDLAAWAAAARTRERVRSEAMRVFWVVRAFVLRAGELTGLGDDAFFLSLDELLAVLDGGPVPDDVAAQRAAYDHFRARPAPPPLVRGPYLAPRPEPIATGPVNGTPASGGVVEGRVRVLTDIADAADLEPGEVLVTSVTNVGWATLFPIAAAVVTDVGATLSHAAIVARELGIPAVVGCGTATTALRTGERVRVDGGRGTVERLDRGGEPLHRTDPPG